MQEIEIIRMYIGHLIKNGEIVNQQDFGASLGYNNKSSFSQLLKREKVSNDFLEKLYTVYPNYISFRKDYENLLDELEKVYAKSREISYNVDKKHQADIDLKRIAKNIKDNNRSEGRIIDENDLVPALQFIIPLKGQAGLRKAFFYPDEYINTTFEKETIFVKPSERGTYYKIEVDGNSMVGKLDPGDWTRCEDIPKMYWIEKGTFKADKIYCLIHRTRGILFKRISNILLENVTLTSDNPDKVEFPDETFDLNEFSKILIVRKIEKDA